MDSSSDSTRDWDQELPVFDCRPSGSSNPAPQRSPNKPEGGDSDAELPAYFSPKACEAGDVMMITSDSEDDVPHIPLMQRLKHSKVISTSTGPNEKNAKLYLPSKPASLQLPGLDQVRRTTQEGFKDTPLRPLSVLENSDIPAKRSATKRTTEDVRASGGEALKRRQARKGQQREKDAFKQEQERNKAKRKALAEAAKALRPEECIKHMVVVIDPAHLQLDGGGTLLASVQALGCCCSIEKQPLPCSVSWARRAPSAQMNDGACVPEAHVVMQITVEKFITLIHNYTQEERLIKAESGPTLTSWVQQLQKLQPSKILSLAVVELEKHFREQKKRFREETGREKQRRKQKKDGAGILPDVSRVDVEEAAVHLQLHTGVSVHFFSTWKDYSDYITMTTKAIAETPFKRARETTPFSFHLGSEWAGGQRVHPAGKGQLQVWKRQIQQFNRVSPEVAAAILAAYPSPQLLRKAYSLCRTECEKVSLLSELLVRRGEGITSTSRRVGPELSKRLYLMMQSCDPEQVLDGL